MFVQQLKFTRHYYYSFSYYNLIVAVKELFVGESQPRFLILIVSHFSVERFPDSSNPDKSKWSPTLDVVCGWGKSWDPPTVIGCVDPRGCPLPPLSTDIIWGSYDDSVIKSLDVGASYWYSCRTGLFEISSHNLSSVVDLNCVNGPNGTPPLWIPAYDHFINPFPPCVAIREYLYNCISTFRASWKYFLSV